MTLRDIYLALSEMAVGDVVARNIDEIKLAVRASDCPVRMLLPATEGNESFIAIGTLTKTYWRLRDLCLWQPIVEGTGIEQCAQDMLAYIELYTAAIRKMRNPTPESVITTATIQLGPVPWATSDFWAVDITVEVEEYLS
jgi:hypothetical protein